MYIVVANSLGVPSFLLFGNLPLMDISAKPLDVVIIPSIPSQVGEPITIIVTDGNNHGPVEGVMLVIGSTNGIPAVAYMTDANGKVEATYLGGYTYISATKSGYQPKQAVVPQVSDDISNARLIAALSALSVFAAFAGPTLSVFVGHWLRRDKQIHTQNDIQSRGQNRDNPDF
jgi:hypothetical protein